MPRCSASRLDFEAICRRQVLVATVALREEELGIDPEESEPLTEPRSADRETWLTLPLSPFHQRLGGGQLRSESAVREHSPSCRCSNICSKVSTGSVRGIAGPISTRAVHSDDAHSFHCIATILVCPSGQLLGWDEGGRSLLLHGDGLQDVDGYLCCSDPELQPRLSSALQRVHHGKQICHLLITGIREPVRRFSLIIRKSGQTMSGIGHGDEQRHIVCEIAPLDRRRLATVRQLMELFGLSAAEARLVRALAGGETLEEYAHTQELKMPTVRTQLSSAFQKTHTERQATLVGLITAIPVIRD